MLLVEALSSLEPQAINYLAFHVDKYNISKDEVRPVRRTGGPLTHRARAQLDQGRLAATRSSPDRGVRDQQAGAPLFKCNRPLTPPHGSSART